MEGRRAAGAQNAGTTLHSFIMPMSVYYYYQSGDPREIRFGINLEKCFHSFAE